MRRFWRGDPGLAGTLASHLCGSAALYQHSGKEPLNSINYLTCHDGFTLNDVVSYTHKHNEANGDDSHDGADQNYSGNYGVEGPSDDLDIDSLHQRQTKNMIATLMLSRGVPLLLGGNEFRRSQLGNNNAYCQDYETSWYDWSLLEMHQEIHDFPRAMIAYREEHSLLRDEKFCAADELCILCNAEDHMLEFELPEQCGSGWRQVVDTSQQNMVKGTVLENSSIPAQSFFLAVLERTS